MFADTYRKFSIPGILAFEAGKGGLPMAKVRNELGEADVYLYGAHVTHFQPKGEKPLLWMSSRSPYAEGSNLRGGIPVCWPWFGPHQSNKGFPAHGFARNRIWAPESAAVLSDGRTRLALALADDEKTRTLWDLSFRLRLTITVGTELEMELECFNTGSEPFRYNDSFHTYFAVGDVRNIEIKGFTGLGYVYRSAAGDARALQAGDYKAKGETVNIYFNDPPRCSIEDPGLGRRIVVEKSGARASVVWTPWAEGGARVADIGDEWPVFVCVETANCVDASVFLLPDTSHATRALYRIERI
jgi:glucose-6-phosphate 1-epimerase